MFTEHKKLKHEDTLLLFSISISFTTSKKGKGRKKNDNDEEAEKRRIHGCLVQVFTTKFACS
jgi:hypothetical protein